MSDPRAISLTRRALQPGADLTHDPYHMCPVDALHALGRCKTPLGAQIIHAKFGELDIERLKVAALQVVMQIFVTQGWEVLPRKLWTVEDTLRMFTDQVVEEYLGEPCKPCHGRGHFGMAYGDVSHSLIKCKTCHGKGSVKMSKVKARKTCPTCLGKKWVPISQEQKAKRTKPCHVCHGTGRKLGSTRVRGKALRYDHAMVVKLWGERFNHVLREIRRIQREAIQGVSDVIYPEEEA